MAPKRWGVCSWEAQSHSRPAFCRERVFLTGECSCYPNCEHHDQASARMSGRVRKSQGYVLVAEAKVSPDK